MQKIDIQQEKKLRLKEIRLRLGLTQVQMANILGVQRGNLSKIEKGEEGRNVPKDAIYKLEKEFNINPVWFESGEGGIFLPGKKTNAKDIGDIISPESEDSFVEISPGRYRMKVKLVPEFAHAGYLSGFSDPEYIEDLPAHEVTVTQYHRGRYRAFEVTGDSMNDGTINSIPDGTIVTGREIKRELWGSKFHSHKYPNWVFVHRTEGIVVKQIAKQDLETGIITLHSLNPDKDQYPDFDVHLDDVIQVYNVVKRELP